MPICPRCRSEYREGFARCADCRVPLVDELPPAEPAVARPTRVEEVRLATFATDAEALMWAELLESQGIRTVLVRLGPGAAAWGSPVQGPYELRVAAAQASHARAVLTHLR